MLKLFYVCLFVASGVGVPFFPTYLKGLGLSGSDLALMMSVAPALHLGVPLGWGWLADRTRRPDLLLRIACAGAALGILPFAFVAADARAGLVAVGTLVALYAGFQFFHVTILGLADSLAVDRMRKVGEDYTRVRLWGSASFVVVCAVMGWWLDARAQPGDPLVPAIMSGGFALACLAAFGLRGEPGRAPPHLADVRALLGHRRFLFLVVLAPLHWASLTAYHGFLPVLALDRGFRTGTVGAAFFVAVVAEVAAFVAFPRLRRRFRLEVLLAAMAAITALRWLLIAGVPFGPPGRVAFVALQALHAASFGLFWAATMAWLAEAVPPSLRATGQAMFTAATFGVGNLVGFAAAGRLYDRTGGAEAVFMMAAAIECVPLAMALVAARRPR